MRPDPTKDLINWENAYLSTSSSSTSLSYSRNRLRLALNTREVNLILMDKEAGFKIDNRIRTDHKFPVGAMDVVSVVKTN